ncbi:ATP-binding protein [Duffyella gerundensis]|uniref:ATP-binding protein n=1 Tax=Duffyella gerundensis TaxID=1619313 RepID=UPI001AE2F25F|nr:ATP-binding protein [Duffyella gerundensis]QTO54242.1 ATP-binding protein [Duffyella gerundensis]
MKNRIGVVISSSPGSVIVEINGLTEFEENKKNLQIGKYICISDGNHDYAICTIRNISSTKTDLAGKDWIFTLETSPVGALVKTSDETIFKKGSPVLPVPSEEAFIMEKEDFDLIFKKSDKHNFFMGHLSGNKEIEVHLDGDGFFSKHIGVVGSTGSGKSCVVTTLLQRAVGIKDNNYELFQKQNNTHIVMFDLHSEYKSAFSIPEGKNIFTLNNLSVENLCLPYWILNSEELESLLIESSENNSHNQIAIFKRAITQNKKKFNRHLNDVNYDTPCYFSMSEVITFIDNVDREIIGKLDGEGKPKKKDGTLVEDIEKEYFDSRVEFIQQSNTKESKASNGPFNGEFTRFVSRLETKMRDERLSFLLKPQKFNETNVDSSNFLEIIKQFIGYSNKSNISIIDVSGVPFEVLSVTISLISRIIFDFCFHYSKTRHSIGEKNDIPVLLVCEEAHNYVPASDYAAYRASRKSIERIAKEGRKYGLSLMVISQRPSEVSPTIFSQCNNFVALRLTNKTDQNYIKGLLPENTNSISDFLPSLTSGEALVVGDAVLMPSIVQLEKPLPEPQSASVEVFKEWCCEWKEPSFDKVISKWLKLSTQ